MLKAPGILAPPLLVRPFKLAKHFPVGLVMVAVVVAGMSAFRKELKGSKTVASPDDRPFVLSQDKCSRLFRRVAAARLSIVAVDQIGSELLLGAVELIRKGNMLESEQNIVGLRWHWPRCLALGFARNGYPLLPT